MSLLNFNQELSNEQLKKITGGATLGRLYFVSTVNDNGDTCRAWGRCQVMSNGRSLRDSESTTGLSSAKAN